MKVLFVFATAVVILFMGSSFKQDVRLNNANDWGDWSTISSSYPGIEGRVKKGDYNSYARKYYWYFQFRNRYNQTVEFNYGYKPQNESYDCSPDHRKNLQPGEISDITGDLLNENYKVRVCIDEVAFR